MDFKEWLKEEMRARGVNPSQLAGLAKVPQPTIFRILSGETKDPRQNTVKKLERALGSASPPLEIEAPAEHHRELVEAWEYLLPGQQQDMLDQIKRLAATNKESAERFRPKPAEKPMKTYRATDLRQRQVDFEGPDRRKPNEIGDE